MCLVNGKRRARSVQVCFVVWRPRADVERDKAYSHDTETSPHSRDAARIARLGLMVRTPAISIILLLAGYPQPINLSTDNMDMQASRTDARFSTYSGAPSLQPSLAPTFDTQETSHRSSTNRSSQYQYLMAQNTLSEKGPYGQAGPQAAASSSTLNSADPKAQDIKSWSGALERMQDARLDKQRYEMSGNKSEEVSKLALGAKVERALARRMTGQDAQFTGKKTIDQEKRSLEVEAN